VTSWPAAYDVEVAHGVAAAHCAALNAALLDCESPLLAEQPTRVEPRRRARTVGSVLAFMPS
jgi:hypothetical protein